MATSARSAMPMGKFLDPVDRGDDRGQREGHARHVDPPDHAAAVVRHYEWCHSHHHAPDQDVHEEHRAPPEGPEETTTHQGTQGDAC
jgi:hypothetical protein